jgi:hypothetical protein
MGRRLAYMLPGFVAGFSLAVIRHSVKVGHFEIGSNPDILGVAGAWLSLWIAQRKRKLKSLSEMERPISLFPKE